MVYTGHVIDRAELYNCNSEVIPWFKKTQQDACRTPGLENGIKNYISMCKITKNEMVIVAIFCLISSGFLSCAGSEQKKMEFFNKGKALYEKKDVPSARIEFKNAIQADPNFAPAYYYLARVELMAGNFRDSLEILTKTTELDPQHWDAQLILGRLYLAAKMYDKALEKARLIESHEKDHMGAILLEASVLVAKKDTEGAADAMVRLENRRCTEPEYYILKAIEINRTENTALAEETLKTGINHNPNNIALYLMLAQIFNSEKRYTDLEDILKKMISIEPDNEFQRFSLSDTYLKQGKTTDADRVVQTLLFEKKDREDIYVRAARYYMKQKRTEDARNVLLKGKDRIEKCYDIRIALSSILVSEHKNDDALKILSEALSFDKNPSANGILKTKSTLANLYMSMNRSDMAQKYTDEILKANPGSLDALYTQGMIGISRNNPIDAVSSFRSILSATPANEDAYSLLSKAHMMHQDKLLALDILKQGLKALPESDRLKKDLADYEITNKQYDDAEKCYKELLAAHPGNTDLLSNLAVLYELTNRKDKALEQYHKIEQLYPTHHMGYIKTAKYYIRNGQLDTASQVMETARQKLAPNAELNSLLVKTYATQKLYDKAVAVCDQQILSKQEEGLYLNLKASVFEAAGRKDEAVRTYEQASTVNPDWSLPVENLARITLKDGQEEQAEKRLLDFIGKHPESSSTVVFLGQMYASRNKTQKAIDRKSVV
jgi:tetratricopeptide (TPR) repeat protein